MAKISVIGAGVGGMSAAARLAKQGHAELFMRIVIALAVNAELSGLAITVLIPVLHC